RAAAPALPALHKFRALVNPRTGQPRGNREPDPDTASRRREDRGVDADHLPVDADERPARVAAIDRGIRLDEVVVGAGVYVALPRRDDPGGNGPAEPERIADRDHPVADARLGRVAELQERQRLLRLHLEQGDVGFRVTSDERRGQRRLVMEADEDLVGVLDDMVVGDDVAVRVDHEAGTERRRPPRRRIRTLLALEEFLEKLLERRAGGQLRYLRNL